MRAFAQKSVQRYKKKCTYTRVGAFFFVVSCSGKGCVGVAEIMSLREVVRLWRVVLLREVTAAQQPLPTHSVVHNLAHRATFNLYLPYQLRRIYVTYT